MTDRQATATTNNGGEVLKVSKVDLSHLPPVYVLATHLSINEQHEAKDALTERGAPLTHDIQEGKIVLGNISRIQRAKLELKWKGIRADEIRQINTGELNVITSINESEPAVKKRKIKNQERTGHAVPTFGEDSTMVCETAGEAEANSKPMSQLSISELPSFQFSSSLKVNGDKLSFSPPLPVLLANSVIVVRLEWLNTVVSTNRFVPLEPYIILHARTLPAEGQREPLSAHTLPTQINSIKHVGLEDSGESLCRHDSGSIIERAKTDPKPKPVYSRHRRRDRVADAAKSDIIGKSFSSSQVTRPSRLLHHSTSEDNEVNDSSLPPMPDWVLHNKIYSCERPTRLDSRNSEFIKLLKEIRLARELTLDQIGVRAYSTSIASIAAYPYPLQSSREVLSLPGCDTKIAHLFNEYHATGQLQAVLDIDADPALTCLRSFFEIWGVGAITAREFYYDKGWRDLDDIIEYGWSTLSRVQQIGLKYYDEFHEPLTRQQVEDIAATITHHAALVTDTHIQTAIVGGYRRGKPKSNDVDIILSHPNESHTLNLVTKVVNSLEKEGWITHTLTLNLTTSHRDQATLPINTGTAPGHGFDSLDKALVVWQSPHWPTSAADPDSKNPNPHRRVDIIVSPWRTVGCAVAGWTSGTTFQRDLRRYCKYVKGWKFDSSGVRERGTGAWVDLEGYRDERTRCMSWEEAEKRVFRGLGLVWREPWERCTG